jgi:hypothetical protein
MPPRVTGFLLMDSLAAGNWELFTAAVRHLVLPALVLGWFIMGIIARTTRSSLLEVLAADYVRTHTDLATMEAANEAARRATNAILALSGIDAPPCGLWQFDIPKPMRQAQVIDRIRFRMGLPNLLLAVSPP